MAFLKRKRQPDKKKGADHTVDYAHFSNEKAEKKDEHEKDIHPELSFHPDWHLSTEEKYVYQFLNNECPPMKPNQLSLSGVELEQQEDSSLVVTAFVRNSLQKSVKLEKVSLLLLSDSGKLIARKTFDLRELGELPPESSRPWEFVFEKQTVLPREWSKIGWKLAFELKVNHRLDLEESWEQSLTEPEKEKLRSLVSSLTPPKLGEVKFMGVQAKQTESGDLNVTLLIRNGSDRNLAFEKLPLVVEDANRDIVAKGSFQLPPLHVKANTSKPWAFVFPKAMLTKDKIDLSKWKVYPPNQKSKI